MFYPRISLKQVPLIIVEVGIVTATDYNCVEKLPNELCTTCKIIDCISNNPDFRKFLEANQRCEKCRSPITAYYHMLLYPFRNFLPIDFRFLCCKCDAIEKNTD